MINTVPVTQITIGIRGKCMHDLEGFICDLIASNANMVIVHSGYIRYKNIRAFGSTIVTAITRNNLDYSVHRIAGENERLVLFRR